MRLTRMLLTAACLLLTCGVAAAQEQPPFLSPTPLEYPTRIEALLAETGTVIVRGHTRVGSMQGSRGNAYFTAWEVFDARSGRREQGISVEIGDAERDDYDERVYIDYDEIAPLLKGIEYLSKLGPQVTKLTRFEAQYQTRGGLRLIAFNTSNNFITAITTGEFGRCSRQRFILRPTGLAEFRTLIENARDLLDAARQP
ncbi:MAG TPA: hypothetical protein VGV38_08925 [Pyrinomonadaceae bacterium]|nr:hypothetical protein [Pyrinomonadaceae bacterium]